MTKDYRMQVVRDLNTLNASEWHSLRDANGYQPGDVFLSLPWLQLMQVHGCVDNAVARDTGWQPEFVTLRDSDDRLVAACPIYRKFHSYGEYVFDWAWANAYQQHGLEYYPKLLSAIPFTPVRGQRLLAVDADARSALVQAILAYAKKQKVSSFHCLLAQPEEQEAFNRADLMPRKGVQFHWLNAKPGAHEGIEKFTTFDDFLASLTQPKRKKIRAERRKVLEQGVSLERLIGEAITPEDWHFFYRCYERTYLEHRSTPYLNEAFFQAVGRAMPDNFILVKASFEGTPIAASLLMRDKDRLYGRYWGALAHVPCLHFEACYYQAIEAAIELGLEVMEGGAQGEHKMARGFLPTVTSSAHWLAEPAFANAVQKFLDRESEGMESYVDELTDRSPFKTTDADSNSPLEPAD
jgi:uncharacterized protein